MIKFQTTPRVAAMLERILRVAFILLLAFAAVSQPGCKSKKKLMAEKEAQEAAARASEIENAKAALLALLNDRSMDLDEKERRLQVIKAKNIDDPEVQDLIRQVEEMIAAERARIKAQQDAQNQEQQMQEEDVARAERVQKLTNYFSGISSASDPQQANRDISAALELFASEAAPVLIIINENRNTIDYDRPTTIGKYLHYLKDTGNNSAIIKEAKADANGKITELVLTKEK